MSISSISSSTDVYRNQFQQIRKDFTSLQSSLSSSDLTGAQSAYAALTQDLQNVNQTRTTTNTQASTDLAAVGTALQSGDLAGAQSAFGTLTQDLQNVNQIQGGQQTHKGHHHHHHYSDNSQNANSTLSTDLAAVSTALQSGDLSSAQSAFATLTQDLQNGGALLTTGQNYTAGSLFDTTV
ncbi:MAG TPA: hypothetical protein VMT62_00390 [Syntrophorhabdaceae bacterium]|nr:hypothetical protein [Syntrophorhabdaceae bacterium]